MAVDLLQLVPRMNGDDETSVVQRDEVLDERADGPGGDDR